MEKRGTDRHTNQAHTVLESTVLESTVLSILLPPCPEWPDLN